MVWEHRLIRASKRAISLGHNPMRMVEGRDQGHAGNQLLRTAQANVRLHACACIPSHVAPRAPSARTPAGDTCLNVPLRMTPAAPVAWVPGSRLSSVSCTASPGELLWGAQGRGGNGECVAQPKKGRRSPLDAAPTWHEAPPTSARPRPTLERSHCWSPTAGPLYSVVPTFRPQDGAPSFLPA